MPRGLSQGLVLTLQLIELGYRVVLALNFMDQAKKRYTIDVEKLSSLLGIPVVPMTATTRRRHRPFVESDRLAGAAPF